MSGTSLSKMMIGSLVYDDDGVASFVIPRVQLRNTVAGAEQHGRFFVGSLTVTPREITFSYGTNAPTQLRLQRADVVGLILTWRAIFSRRSYLSFHTSISQYSFCFRRSRDRDLTLQLWTTPETRWER